MYQIHHTQPATAAAQSLYLARFLPCGPCLCVVKHTSLVFIALTGAPNEATSSGHMASSSTTPLDELCTLPINARILRVVALPGKEKDRLAVLTDHHSPRLFVLRFDGESKESSSQRTWAQCIVTEAALPLDELGRQPAESGLTLEVERHDDDAYAFTHTHAGIVRVVHIGEYQNVRRRSSASSYRSRTASGPQKQRGSISSALSGGGGDDGKDQEMFDAARTTMSARLARAFTARLPHPHLVSSTFLERKTSQTRPLVALLSLSSTTSRLPGLGMQCLPVLSFHELCEEGQELRPVPWLPSQTPLQAPPSPEQVRRSSTSGRARPSRVTGTLQEEDGTATPRSGSRAPPAMEPSSGRYGPAASGRVRTTEQEAADEEALAKTAYARAHVPLPFSDALGAHLLVSLPARAGGGVVVFSETSILYVPPPAGSESQGDVSTTKSPVLSAAGKRRKGSGAEPSTVTPQQGRAVAGSSRVDSSSALSTSPTTEFVARSPANENGKRRRSTASSSAVSVGHVQGTRRRSSAASTRSTSGPHLLRAKLPAPAITVTACVVREPNLEEDDGIHTDADGYASINVLFCTHAGRLELLTIDLQQAGDGHGESFSPTGLSTTSLGQVSAPGGPGAVTYLGENLVHIASASGDSLLTQIADSAEPEQRGPPTLKVIHRWANLAPILDFAVDDGAGKDPAGGDNGQARIITCSGSGPTGSLRIIRNGVSTHDILSLAESDVRRIWSIDGLQTNVTRLLVFGNGAQTRIMSIESEGISDNTAEYLSAGLDVAKPPLDVATIAPGVFAIVQVDGVHLFSVESRQRIASWPNCSSNETEKSAVTSAAVNSAGQILLGMRDGTLAFLQASQNSITLQQKEKFASEISAISISPLQSGQPATLAAVSLWKPSVVKLLSLPSLEDVTPMALISSQPSFVRSLLLHTFIASGKPITGPHLFLGLGNGSIVSMQLSLPTKDSISRAIGISERRVGALSMQPVQLRQIVTSEGHQAVLANSDKLTIVFSTGSSLTYSALRHTGINDTCPFTYADVDGSIKSLTALARNDEVILSTIGQVHKLDISTIELGCDNPLAIALCAQGREAAAVTTAFLPEGRDSQVTVGGKVKLFETTTSELVDEFQLEDEERPNCIKSFERNGDTFLAVGTGYCLSDRSETLNGRINVFQVLADTRKLALACSMNVEGNVYDIVVSPDSDKLVAAVNASVCLYEIEDESDNFDGASFMSAKMQVDRSGDRHATSELALSLMSSWSCAFTATSLRLLGSDRILVGDALRSLVLLGITSGAGDTSSALHELARDCDPFWTVSCDVVDADNEVYIGSDIAFNLFTCKRLKWSQSARDRLELSRRRETEVGGGGHDTTTDAIDTTWSHIMQREAAFHYGDLVNTMKRASLIRTSTSKGDSEATGSATTLIASPRVIFGTAAGAIGIIAKIDEQAGSLLGQLSARLGDASKFTPVGGIANDEWRKLRTDHRTQAATGFVDGDMVRDMYDALSYEERAALLQSGNVPMTASLDEVNNLVESLRHLS